MFKYVKFTKVEDEFTTHTFRGGDETVKVNHFDIDVVSLESEDEVAISETIITQNEIINCEVITKEEFVAIYKTTEQYKRVLDRTEDYLNKMMENIDKEYPSKERETWSMQILEANNFLETNDESKAPLLKILADDEDDTVENFANAVVAKNNVFTLLSANALKEKRRFKKELMSAVGA